MYRHATGLCYKVYSVYNCYRPLLQGLECIDYTVELLHASVTRFTVYRTATGLCFKVYSV